MRVKIITYNTVIIFCHFVEFAIFAVGDFFSLFGIAVFNIPISHIIIVLLFLLQSYCFFRYFQIFFDFFHYCRVDLPLIANFVLLVFLTFPGVLVLCPGPGPVVLVLVVCPAGYLPAIRCTRIHTRIYTHAHEDF